jgi:hypothetical protein
MKRNLMLSMITVLLALLAMVGPANAQAPRTWVSGVGDDTNPCSRTAPCKTFAGAISKTAAGGIVSVLDPGGFGAVTITKSITISATGVEAGVLVSGTNGIVISAGNADVVVLRGLDIEGLGTGLSGIKVLSAGAVHVENCTINNFTQNGIEFVPSSATATTSQLQVSDTIVRNNTGGSSGGIHVKPGANVTAVGSIENTVMSNNAVGIRVEDNSTISAKNTTAANNQGSGFIAASTVGGVVNLNLDTCLATGNGTGIKADLNASATVRIANCTIAGNTNGLVAAIPGARIISYLPTNHNFDSGAPTSSVGPQSE